MICVNAMSVRRLVFCRQWCANAWMVSLTAFLTSHTWRYFFGLKFLLPILLHLRETDFAEWNIIIWNVELLVVSSVHIPAAELRRLWKFVLMSHFHHVYTAVGITWKFYNINTATDHIIEKCRIGIGNAFPEYCFRCLRYFSQVLLTTLQFVELQMGGHVQKGISLW